MSFRTSKEELTELLSEVGAVVDVHIPTDRESGRPRGFAFVRFSSDDEAAEAIRRFNGFEFQGRRLNVNEAEDRPRRPDGPKAGPGPRRDGPPRERSDRPDRGGAETRSRPAPARPVPEAPPPPDPTEAAAPMDNIDYRHKPDDDDEDDFGGRSFRGKGSRRGLRARKRSL